MTNIEFRTQVDIPKPEYEITHQDRVMLVGSCFSDNIYDKLKLHGFHVFSNPNGIVYNPISICNSLQRILNNQPYDENELIQNGDLWHSFDHHGSFSSISKNECLLKINHTFSKAIEFLSQTNVLIITLGTALVFERVANKKIVANCHKRPSTEFDQYLENPQKIAQSILNLWNQLTDLNPDLKLILTISPIRHLKNSAHLNQLSKSTLFVAIHQLEKLKNIYYFPAYEIVMDELRDYRFYQDDLCHPTNLAVEYIWEKFTKAFFNSATQKIAIEANSINLAKFHRPINPESLSHQEYIQKLEKRMIDFKNKYPNINI